MNEDRIGLYIKALLSAAETQGSDGLSTTALTKFLYLLDYYSCLKAADYTRVASDWKFHHFGPYSYQVDLTVKQMEADGSLVVESMETSSSEDATARIYRLPNWTSRTSLRDLELPKNVPLRLETDMSRFRYNVHALLNYVYFETGPMESAKPGKLLVFPGPGAEAKPEDVRVFKMQIEISKVERIKSLLASRAASLKESRQVKQSLARGIYDDHYFAFESRLSQVSAAGVEGEADSFRAIATLSGLYDT